MDPDANLAEQRELASAICAAADAGRVPEEDLAARLAELVLALDEWLCRGGCAPRRWRAR